MKNTPDLACSISQIRMFLAAAETGSFSEAAEAMHVEQSTFSRRISTLEDSLGLPLFDRSARPLRLTAEGQLLRDTWSGLLAQLDLSLERAHALHRRRSGRLTVCTIDSANIQSEVLDASRQMLHDFSDISISLEYVRLSHWRHLLLSDEADISLTTRFEALALDGQFTSEAIFTFPKLVCMLRTNPLSGRSGVSLSDLRDMEFIVIDQEESPEYAAYVRGLCQAHGFTPRFSTPISNAHGFAGALQRPDQVFLCDRLLRGYDDPLFRVFPLPDVESGLYAVWRSGNENPYIPAFIQRLRSCFRHSS